MHVLVLSSEVPPLEAVDWSEVALLAIVEPEGVQEGARGVAVPDANVLGLRTKSLIEITQLESTLGRFVLLVSNIRHGIVRLFDGTRYLCAMATPLQ